MSLMAMPYGWGRVPFDYDERSKWANLPFPVSEYEERTDRARAAMAEQGFEALVIVGVGPDSANIRYLSNFQDFYGGETVMVITADHIALVTNAVMHGEPMHSGIQDAWMADVRAAAAPRTVTGAAKVMTIDDHVKDMLSGLSSSAKVGLVGRSAPDVFARMGTGREAVPTTIVHEMRTFKSPLEVEVLRKAAHIADAGLVACMESVAPGITEFDAAAAATEAMFRAGAEHPSFPIALTAGPRAGLKHAAPTPYVVKPGDIVYVDLGGRYMG
jgi:Xaa-Pro dipeptidase